MRRCGVTLDYRTASRLPLEAATETPQSAAFHFVEITSQENLPMYAIIVDGGRQYKVEPGMELDVDFRDIAKGENMTFEKVLAVGGDEGLKLGSPTVLGMKQDKKIYIQKFRRRKDSKRRTGHRQKHLRVRIEKIAGV